MSIVGGYGKHGFDAYGEKILKAEHMKNWMSNPMRTDPCGISFELGKSIAEVEDGFFLLLPTISELFILNPDCNVRMSDESISLFRKNNVLIRGEFDGNAEKFAKEYGLRFLHSDVELAKSGDFNSRAGANVITLRFRQDGGAYIHDNTYSEYGGGELSFDLPENFYLSLDAAYIAERYGGPCCDDIKASGTLEALLEKARKNGGFLIDFSA